MKHYIDKDALVAEIERRIKQFVNENNTLLKNSDNAKELRSRIIMCKEILSLIDTLEVKEVDLEFDLEKEICDWIGDEENCKDGKWTWNECNKMIKHFYELGLKAQRGE